MLQSSDRRFSMGVPVSAKRCRAVTAFTARAESVSWFFMYCASSRTSHQKSMGA